MNQQIDDLKFAHLDRLDAAASKFRVPLDLVKKTISLGRLPVVNFAAGGIATPADAALMMQLGVDGIFVGSGIFKSNSPGKFARAIVEATSHYSDPKLLVKVSTGIGEAMQGIEISKLETRMQERGW
ncbi:Pyridoxal 5'-phosphate synthase subunit PdxS [uncultured archaeon]|nr:Pyridoxal 5'-phosphate synthase subunit PdxS [uncultured archaeon]